MPSQTTSRRIPTSPERTAELDAQPHAAYVDGYRSASQPTRRPRRGAIPMALLPHRWFTGRPRSHLVGHAIGDPPPPSFEGCPRGHTVGHRIGDPPPPSFDGRPRGHVVGHAVAPHPSPR